MPARIRKRKHLKPRGQQSFYFEALEPRLLLSADPLGAADLALAEPTLPVTDPDALAAVLPFPPRDPAAEPATALAPPPIDLAAMAAEPPFETRQVIAFVDSSIADYQGLIERFDHGDMALTVVLIDAAEDGLAQISQALDGGPRYDALHVFSHGDDSGLQLGSGRLDGTALAANADAIAGWGAALSADADILLYGCDLAGGADGRRLVNALATLTGADVAASDDPSGSALLGGDWELEHRVGQVETAALLAMTADDPWQGLLGATAVGGEIAVNQEPLAWAQSTINATPDAVAADAAGNFIVVWESDGQDGKDEGIYARRFDPTGAALGPEFLVNDSVTDRAQVTPAVAMNADGAFVVVWQTDAYSDPAADGRDIYARLVDKDGNDSGEFRVNSGYTTDDQTDPTVTVRDDGSFIVAWTSKDQDGSRTGIFAQRFTAAGSVDGSQIQVNNVTPEDQLYASIDSNVSGQFAVTWTGKDLASNKLTVYARLFDADGAPADKQFIVDQNQSEDQQYSDIALLDDGSLIVAWQSARQDGGSDGIYARRFGADGEPLGNEFLVNDTTPGLDEGAPSIAADDAGNFVVTWTRDGTEVYLREFDALGDPVDATDVHVTAGVSEQSGASVAMTGIGRYVVVYSGEGSGDVDGVFARRYTIAAAPTIDLNGAAAGSDSAAAFVEDGAPVLIADAAAEVTYAAGPDLSKLVVVLTNPVDGAAEVLAADTSDPSIDPGITAIFADGRLTISGSGPVPVTDLVKVLRTVTYENTSQAPTPIDRSIRVLAADASGLFGPSAFVSMTVEALNDAPVITAPATATTAEDTGLVFTPGGANEVSVADDSGAGIIEVALTATDGTVTLTNRLGDEFQVNAAAPADQQLAAVAVAADGRYVVVWEQNNGLDKEDIYARTFAANGVAISGDILVNNQTGARQGSADVAIDAAGNFVVVWETDTENLTNKYDINARTFAIDGTAYGNAVRVNNQRVDDQLAPAVAMDPDGSFVVTWQSKTATNGREIYLRPFDLEMNDLAANDILVNTTAASDQTAPDIAVKDDGQIVVVWQSKDQDGSGEGIYLRRFDAAFDPLDAGETLVNAFTVGDHQTVPTVAINDAGQVVVAWQSQGQDSPDGSEGIFAQRYDFASGLLVGGEIAVTTETDGDQLHPAVGIGANGNFVIAWQSPDQDDDDGFEGIFIQEFAADGSRLRFETQVNSYTLDPQTAPAIGLAGDSQYVVVWQSAGQDADGSDGIYGQRFLSPGALEFIQGDGVDDVATTFRGTVESINAALANLTFQPDADYYGPASVTVTVDDRGATGTGAPESASHVVAITVDPVNDAPLLEVPPGTQQVAETVPFVFNAFNGTLISLSDIDAGAGAPPELELSLTVANGILNVDLAGSGVTVSGGANDSATMTLRGTQTELNAALDGLVYTSNLSYLGADTLSLALDDLGNFGSGGAQTAVATVAINVFDFNVPPVNMVPATVTTAENVMFVFAGANKLAVVDNDADPNDDIDVTLSVAHGLLSLPSNPGITITGNWLLGSATLNFRGDKSLVNDALDGLRFTPDTHFAGTTTLQMTTSDLGNSGIDGTKTDQDLVVIQVTPDGTNDAPTIASPGAVTTTEEAPFVFSSVSGQAISVNDDANDQPIRVKVTAADGTVSLSTTVGSQFQANSETSSEQLNAAAAMLPDGGFVLVWQSNNQDDDGFGIFGQRYAEDGSVIGAEFKVNTVFAKHQTDPAVAVAADGSFVVVWVSEDEDGNNKGIIGQRFDADGQRVGAAFQVNTYFNKAQVAPDVAMDASGRFVVVWASDDQDGDDYGVYAQVFDATGAAAGAEFRVNVTTARDQLAPAVAMDQDGDFVVAWQGKVAGDDKWDIYARRFDAAGNARDAGELLVNSVSDETQLAPDVAMDDAGNFVVVWQSKDLDYPDGDYGIYQRAFAADGTALAAKQSLVNTQVVKDQLAPVVARDGDGDYLIAWQGEKQDDPDGKFGVFVQRYAADGSALGGEFRANTTTVKDQRAPAVAAGADGRFVVAWESDGEDGNGYGIFGQLYKDVDGVTFIQGSGRGDAVVEFEAALDDVNNLLDGLVFTPATDFEGVTTLTVEVNDLGNSGGPAQTGSAVTSITVGPLNDAPTFDLPNPQRAYEDVPLVFSSANGNLLRVVDVDAGGGTVTVALTAYGGRLSLAGSAGLSFIVGDGTDDDELRFSGSLAAINAALDGLTFRAAAGFAGAGSIQIAADDGGNSGAGGALTNADAVVVNVESDFVNDAPEIRVPGPQQTAEDIAVTLDDFNGNAVVIEDDAGQAPVRVQLTAVNGTLTLSDAAGPETLVNTETDDDQRFSDMATVPSGAHIVVWQSKGQDAAASEGIFAQLFNPDGRSVGFEIAVNQFTIGNQTVPVVAAAPSGEFAVAWVSDGQDGNGEGIFARKFDAYGNAISGETLVNTDVLGNQTAPAIAMTADGGFVVVWSTPDDGVDLFFQRYDRNGVAVGGQTAVNTVSAGNQDQAAVAMDADGNFVVVWQAADDNGLGIFARRFDAAGVAIDAVEQAVNTLETNGDQSLAAVAMNGSGAYVIAWQGEDADNDGIRASLYGADGVAVRSDFVINALETGNQTNPSVAIAADGTFVVAWESPDDSGLGIYARYFDALGNPVGGDMAVNQTTASDQTRPAVSLDGSDTARVTWTSANQDGDKTGIYVQRLLPPAAVTYYAGSGENDTFVDVEATPAVINGLLNGLIFTPNSKFVGEARIDIAVDDLGNSGSGGALTAQDSVFILIEAPGLDLDADDSSGADGADFHAWFTPGGAAIAVVDSDLSIDTPESELEEVILVLSNRPDGAQEWLSVDTAAYLDIDHSWTAATGELRIFGQDVSANYETLLKAVRYHNTAAAPDETERLITIRYEDRAGDLSNVAETTVFIDKQPPVLTLNGELDYTEGDPAALIVGSITIADPDTEFFAGGRLTIDMASSGSVNDRLAIAGQGGAVGEISLSGLDVSYNFGGATGTRVIGTLAAPGPYDGLSTIVVDLTADADAEAVEALIARVSFENVSTEPATNLRAVRFVLEDGEGGVSETASATVRVANLPSAVAAASESFDYASGVLAGANGGTGWSGAWQDGIGIDGDGAVGDGSVGDDSGLLYTSGGRGVLIDGIAAPVAYRHLGFTLGGSGSEAWIGFVLRPDSAASFADDNYGGLVLGGAAEDGAGGLFIGHRAGNVGLETAGVGSSNYASGISAGEDQPLLLVAHIEFQPGNDVVTLYVNPTPGVVPDGSFDADRIVVKTDLDLGNFTQVALVAGDAARQSFDEIRVGDGYLAVAPATAPNSPPVVASGQTFSLSEAAAVNDPVGTAAASDADVGDTLQDWAIVSGNDDGVFAIDALTGAIRVADVTNLDFETTAAYTLGLQVGDGLVASAVETIAVSIVDANDAPIIVSNGGGANAAVSINENTVAVTDVDATDADGTTPTYGFGGGADDALFTIDPVSGVLSFTAAPDYETPLDTGGDNVYDVIVEARDGVNVTQQAIAVTVIDVLNEVGPLLDDAAATVAENAAATTLVYDVNDAVTGTDNDPDPQALSYSITGGNGAGVFVIDPGTGVVSVADNTNLDYESVQQFVLTLEATDGANVDTATLTIDVLPVNDNNPVADDESFSVNEGGTATEADLDVGSSLLDGDTDADLPNDTLTINTTPVAGPSHGSLTLNSDGTFSYTHDGSENFADSFSYQLLDADGGVADIGIVTITIVPVNDNNPVADDESFTVNEGGTATEANLDVGTSLLDGDTDADLPNDTLTVNTTAVAGPSHGSLTLDADGTFSYTHDGSENFSDSFTYQVRDANGGLTDIGTVAITIVPVNDNDPVADDESFSVNEGGTATEADLDVGTSLLDGDSDADLPNDTLTINTTPVAGPSHGSLTLNADGTFSYTHDGSENFADSFTYQLVDADGGVADSGTVTITIVPVNDNDPVADDESFTVNEGGTATEANLDVGTSLLDGDTDADLPNDTLTINTTPVAGPSHGALTLNANGTFSYTHDGSENFADSFTYQLLDADGGVADTGTVTITIVPVNDNNPVADDESFTVNEGGTATEANLDVGSSLLDGDTDADLPNDTLTVNTTPLSGPSHGALTLNANGTFSYTHDGSENFSDSFSYQLLDADGGVADTGTVTITIVPVNDNDPVADDESFTVNEGGTATEANLDVGTSLLDGDSDADLPNDTLTINTTPVAGPSHGALTLNANGTFSYTHDGSENFSDSFTYQLLDADGGVADIGTVTITVLPVNDNDPVADDESFSVNEGGTATEADLDAGTSLLDGDTDADLPNDTLTVNTTPLSGPSHGSLTLNGDGTFSYTHDGSENFADSFTYQLLDADGGVADTGTVTITIVPVNDNNPVADDESFSVNEGGTATEADLDVGTSLLDGDSDADLPNDTLTINTTPVAGPSHGSLTLNGDGTFSYTHDGSENFADSFTYQLLDADGGVADTGTVTITVVPINDNPPVIISNGGGATASIGLNENTAAVTDVDATDADGTTPSYGFGGGADDALFNLDPVSGVLAFSTAPDFETPLDVGGDNVYDVIIEARDGINVTQQAIAVTVSDIANEIGPVLADAGVSLAENTAATTVVYDVNDAVTGTDDDPDPQALSYSITGGNGAGVFAIDPGTGIVTVADNINLDYESVQQFVLTVEATDGLNVDTATLTVDVLPVNDNDPVADDESFSVNEGGTATEADLDVGTSLLDGDTDADLPNDVLTVNTTPVAGPSHGALTLNANGTFSYTHDGSENFSDSFSYQLLDADGGVADTGTVTITIVPVNDNDPVADDESFTVNEGGTATEANLDVGTSLLDGDTDADLPNDTLTINTTPVAGPSHGALTLNANGTFSYTHDGSENFSDSFTYQLLDADGGVADIGTVTITVLPVNDNDPAADDESFSVNEGGTATEANLDAGTSLLDGDTDADLPNDTLTVNTTPLSGPSHGALTLNGDGTFSYTHDGSENFADSFTYQLLDADGGVADTGTVTITIVPVNDNNPVADDESFSVNEGGTATEADLDVGTSLLDGDSDADLPNDTLTINTTPVAGPSHGALTLNANGTFSYTHDGSENFADSFSYQLLDADGGVADTGTVTITIVPVNDNNPVADDESFSVNEGGTATEANLDVGSSLLDGDSDADLPNDTLTINTTPVAGPSHGALTLNANGTFSYTHDGSENFSDSFSYQLLDADGGVADIGTVTITVLPVNDNDPVADDESFSVNEGGTATEANLDAGTSLLDGDTDADLPNDVLTVNTTPVTGPSHGALTLNANGTFSYTHDGSENFTDSFTYQLLDADGGVADTGTVTITIVPVNDNDPVADDESFTVNEGGTATEANLDVGTSLLDGDTDADLPNDTLTVNTTPLSGPSHGALTMNANGTFSYTHDGSENFSDSFSYQLLDADGGVTAVGTVTISILPANDAPLLSATVENPTATESGSATNPVALVQAGTVSVVDADAANFAGGIVRVTLDAYRPGDLLTVSGAPAGVASVAGGNGSDLVVTLDAAATPLNVGAIVEAVRFQNSGDDPTVLGTDGDRVFTVTLDDGGNSPGPGLASNPLSGTITLVGENEVPTFTTLVGPVGTTIGNNPIEIGLADLLTASDAADSDGTITGFVIQSAAAGQLRIGTTAATATAWSAGLNDTIDAARNAYWQTTPSATGTIAAFTLTARDDGGDESATPVTAQVVVLPPAGPALGANVLTIDEGGTVVLGGSELAASDPDTAAAALVFTVSDVQHGRFERVVAPGLAITTFTQGEVALGSIRFVHDGGETAPSYEVTVSDGFSTDGAAAAVITFGNVNDAPLLTGNSLTVIDGVPVTIAYGTDLAAVDSDTSDTALIYRVSKVSSGRFELAAAPGTAVTEFTQAELIGGQVRFVPDGAGVAPAYEVEIFDGLTSDGPLAALVTFQAAPPDNPAAASGSSAPPVPAGLELDDLLPLDLATSPPPAGTPLALPPEVSFSSFEPPVAVALPEPGEAGPVEPDQGREKSRDPASVSAPTDAPPEEFRPRPDANRELPAAATPVDVQALLRALTNGATTLNTALAEVASDVGVSAEALLALLQESGLISRLDGLRDELAEGNRLEQSLMGSSLVVSTGLSVGYVVWLIRGGVLLSSVLSSLPAWRMIDPLPVLAALGGRDDDEDGEESLESMVTNESDPAAIDNVDEPNTEAPPTDSADQVRTQ